MSFLLSKQKGVPSKKGDAPAAFFFFFFFFFIFLFSFVSEASSGGATASCSPAGTRLARRRCASGPWRSDRRKVREGSKAEGKGVIERGSVTIGLDGCWVEDWKFYFVQIRRPPI